DVCRGCNGRRDPVYSDRKRIIGGRAVAELTKIVSSPAPHPAVRGNRAHVKAARCDGDGIRDAEHWNSGRRCIHHRSVAELAETVTAPAAHGTIGEQRARVVASGGDVDRIGDSDHRDRSRGREETGGAVAELTEVASSPTADG